MSMFSILMPFVPIRLEQVLAYAALTQWSGAHRLWQGQATLTEPHQGFVFAAACGFRVPAGLGVTLMPLRHPYEAALQAQSLAIATGHPVVAGFGPGGLSFQRSILGQPYRSQLGAVREYVTTVRRLLAGEEVDYEGEFFSCKAKLEPLPRPPVEVGVGVLRPAAARLAGEVADAAITWLTPASYVRDVLLPELRAGAQAAGRAVPRVICIVPVALALPGRDLHELALISNSGHMRLPHYQDMLRRSGITVDMADPTASAKALIEGRAFLAGALEEVAGELRAYQEAGADEVVLNVTGVCGRFGERAALAELETVLKEVAP